jgi:hypothetical protein
MLGFSRPLLLAQILWGKAEANDPMPNIRRNSRLLYIMVSPYLGGSFKTNTDVIRSARDQ